MTGVQTCALPILLITSSFQVSQPISGLGLLKFSIVVSKISTFVHLVDLENVLKQTLGLHGEGVA